MMGLILTAIVVTGPAGMANFAPPLSNKLRFLDRLNIPIDGGKKFRGQRIFGDNKTIKGFVSGFVLALLGVWLQRRILNGDSSLYSQELLTINPFLLALLYDLGALGGDAIESFFKRQSGRPPGSPWPPFDQLDFILGTLLTTWFVVHYPLRLVVVALLVMPVLHVVASLFGYYVLHVKSAPV